MASSHRHVKRLTVILIFMFSNRRISLSSRKMVHVTAAIHVLQQTFDLENSHSSVFLFLLLFVSFSVWLRLILSFVLIYGLLI